MPRTHRSTRRALAAVAAASLAVTALSLPAAAVAAPGAPDDGAVPASITVPKIDGLPADFIGGVDVSSVLSLEASGVVFRDAEGTPGDLFALLADAGVTDVRIRVWNDPYDAQGNGYGGGDVDVPRAVEIGERATDAGLGVLVDFHCSDFWADPAKQQSPKAWDGLDIDARAAALHEFTVDALEQFEAAQVDVEMVQVGNETNNGIAGVTSWDDRARLFSAGAAAVREVEPDALVALHFTNPETPGRYADIAAQLDARGVDYDVFASSYYPFWHGSTDNLTSVLSQIATTYDKQVLVAETSWVHTLDDGDGHGNVIDLPSEATQYPVSQQGQAWALHDVMAAVAAVGDAGIGVYYWEPAWLPVGPPDALEANKALWERDGSGWASSFAGDYDAHDAGQYYGGSAWDNQALFAFDGTALDSLRTFSYVRTGSMAPLGVVAVETVALSIEDGETWALPDTVAVTYNDRSTRDEAVAWTPGPESVTGPGTYAFTGTVADGQTTTAMVTVRERNFVVNGGFEDADVSMWRLTGTGTTLGSIDTPRSGARSAHFWLDSAYAFSLEQTVAGLPAGTYRASAAVQGRAAQPGDRVRITVQRDDSTVSTARASAADAGVAAASEASAAFELTGYAAWSAPSTDTIEVGADGTAIVRIDASLTAGAWGTIDDVTLTRVSAAADTTALAAALARFDGLDRSAFTAASLAAVDAAAADARTVLDALAPTPAAAAAALAALDAALEGLVPVEVASPGADGSSSPGVAADAARLAATGGTPPWAPLGLAALLLTVGAIAVGLRPRSARS